ncbi:MAG: ABC transporter ATP-binding protein [Bauldia sp.]|nr:ABC transporter ATP-binding protein [Bauldia sp.]
MTLIAIRGLTKRYGPVVALDDVDLDIPAEGRTAIVGASGSGKSTLLRLIAGFEAPTAGSIAMAGETLAADGVAIVPAHKRRIGYVSQDGALFPHMSVAANIGFAIRRSDAGRKDRIAGLLELVQLDGGLARRRPHELSGGQQQRVALARALAVRPRVVLLDEPFSALDAGLRESLRQSVAKVLADAGVSTVLVTHDQAEALSFATHLAVLRDGRLAQAGSPRDLYCAPRDPDVAAFLGDAIILPADIRDGWAESRLGRIAVAAPAPAGAATILLRPEQLAIAAVADRNGEGTAAVVTATVFTGAATMVTLGLGDGGDDAAIVTCRVTGSPPAIGDRVRVTVSGVAHVFEH